MYIALQIGVERVAGLARNKRSAIENIGRASFEGRDLVSTPSAVARALSEQGWLSEAARAAYLRLAASASISRSFRAPDFHVTADDEANEAIQNGRAWTVPLATFGSERLAGQRELICENLSDAQFYLLVGEFYRARSKFYGANISLRPMGGGGTTTADMIRQAKARDESFMAIVDSDRESGADTIGDVARTCQREAGEPNPFRRCVISGYRSVENHIPSSWIAETASGRNARDTVDILSIAEDEHLNELRGYGPLHADLRICDLVAAANNALIQDVDDLRSLRPVTPQACQGVCSGACKVWTGLGKRLPDQVVNAEGRIRQAQLEGEFEKLPQTTVLGKEVFEFGVATQRMRL